MIQALIQHALLGTAGSIEHSAGWEALCIAVQTCQIDVCLEREADRQPKSSCGSDVEGAAVLEPRQCWRRPSSPCNHTDIQTVLSLGLCAGESGEAQQEHWRRGSVQGQQSAHGRGPYQLTHAAQNH